MYLLVYTPLKRKTHLATAVGGIPGAIPPVIGWVAITGSISIEAYILFLVLYLWQIPHSLALGWLFREDYRRAGYRLLPSLDPTGKATGRVILLFSIALLPASMLPYIAGLAGVPFLVGILLAGFAFAVPAARFARNVSDRHAKAVFVTSLMYVPAFYGLMWLDRLIMHL
jgi:protoheme IX farnesyltransferase